MKKLIGLMVVLMTIVTLSVSAQCTNGWNVSAVVTPRVYGDFTPCKNQKNVPYSIGNNTAGQPITWYWCRGIPNQLPTSAGFVPTEYRWTLPSMTTATDGITTVNSSSGGYLYTTQTTIAVSYKTRGGFIGVDYKDSCGTWKNFFTRAINLTCESGDGDFAPVATAQLDTGKTIINATVIHGTTNMSFNCDSISGAKKPYTYVEMFEKNPVLSCASNFYRFFSDGIYQQMRQSPSPDLPYYVAYGWSYYFPNLTPSPKTFRVVVKDATGKYFQTLPFTIPTIVPSSATYPTLP
jgi:hypothetical protein